MSKTCQQNPSTTPSDNSKKTPEQKKPLGFGDDDEFEDFQVEDWDDSDAKIGLPANKNQLWENNWDDDDVEDDFSKLLKAELDKVSKSGSQSHPMTD